MTKTDDATSNALISQELLKDPRIGEAKRLLIEVVKAHQRKLTGVRPPNPALIQAYENTLAEFAEYRGAKLYFPYLGSGIGNGALVELLDGSVKYDFISGIGPHYWGHSHLDLVSSGIEAALSDTIMEGNLQQNEDSLEITRLLVKASKLDHCFLSSSGAAANENALKIAFQKKYPASRILAFEHCFAGRSLVGSQITDRPAYREGLPMNSFIDYIPFFNIDKPEESTQQAVNTLKAHIARYPKQHAVMIFELIQGEGGFYTAPREFFVTLMNLLRDNQIPIFIDEIQTFGRTSELFAYQHFDLSQYADLVAIGKLSQVCATLFTKEMAPRAGLLSQTFTSSTSAIKGGKVIIESLLNDGFFGPNGKIMQIHQHFVKNLQDLSKKYPNLVRGPYGLGAMIAFTPLDGDTLRVAHFVRTLFDAGVMSFVAGGNPTRVRFLAPMGAVTPHDINEVTHIIEKTLVECSQKPK
jgi:acetylornithine/N-succinyldiaminopimelate aminotransferase